MEEQADFRATQNNPLDPLMNHLLDNSDILCFGGWFDPAHDQFIVNDPVNHLARLRIRNNDAQTIVLRESAFIEFFFHGKACAQQADRSDSGSCDPLGGGVCNMQEGKFDVGLYFLCDLVHCVGTQDDQLCTAVLKSSRGVNQHFGGFCPSALMLEDFHLGKID